MDAAADLVGLNRRRGVAARFGDIKSLCAAAVVHFSALPGSLMGVLIGVFVGVRRPFCGLQWKKERNNQTEAMK